tara:strand:- start:2308 stop:2886 length:579 start_codon:yes stop_codon:yes gene_type:complete
MSTLSTTNLKNPSSGSNNIVLNADGTTTVAAPSNIIKSGTAVASTSGVAIDFTGIPSWAKRVTVMFEGVSTNGSSLLQLQLGTAVGIQSTGYFSAVVGAGGFNTTSGNNLTSGFGIGNGTQTSDVYHGLLTISIQSAGLWVCSGVLARSNVAFTSTLAGSKNLSGTLDRVRITTVNGTDTFDAGSINLLWEG